MGFTFVFFKSLFTKIATQDFASKSTVGNSNELL